MQIRRVIELSAFLTILYIFVNGLIIGIGLNGEVNEDVIRTVVLAEFVTQID